MLTEQTRGKFIRIYVVLFYILALLKWLQGGWLYQYDPFIFHGRFDGVTWVFMQTRLHQYLISHPGGFLIMDLLFYSMPLLYGWVYERRRPWIVAAGVLMLLVNWTYVQVYTLFPTDSIEGHIAWLLMPMLFMSRGLKTFGLMMEGLRYFFLFFFFSAGLWKIREGGVFNLEQMSNILLLQHKEVLVSSGDGWYSRFIYWLAGHRAVSYGLYVAGTLAELVFGLGFFTRRFDKWLILIFLAFLVMDALVMKIGYYDVLPLLLPLVFSRHQMPRE